MNRIFYVNYYLNNHNEVMELNVYVYHQVTLK